jgi:hypothetical protein
MANMLAQSLDPVQQALRYRINTGAVLPMEPVVPGQEASQTATPAPTFAQPAVATPTQPTASAPSAPVASAPAAPTADVTNAIRARINPQVGQMRTFPNGRIGRYDGNGWEHVG